MIHMAVADHARSIQLGMVCLFLAVFLIWLLYYRSDRRRILHEQQTALGRVTEELHHLSEQGRHARSQLEQQITLYRGILNAIPMGLYWKNSEGRLVGYNPEYAHIAGLKRMEDGLSSVSQEAFERQQDGLPLDMEVMNKDIELLFLPQRFSPRGITKHYLVSKIPVKDSNGRICGLLGSLMNRDLLNAAQERSFCSILKTDCVSEMLPAPMLIVDRRGRILHCNAAFIRHFGLNGGSIVDHPLHEIFSLTPDNAFDLLQCEGVDSPAAETREFSVRRGGDTFLAMAQPISENGVFKGALLLLMNTSISKQTEHCLENLLLHYHQTLHLMSQQMSRFGDAEKCSSHCFSSDSADISNLLKSTLGACLEKAGHFDILSMETTDYMETTHGPVNIRQLVEAVREHLVQRYAPEFPQIDIVVGAECPESFEGNWHKLYQTLTILSEHAVECSSGRQIVLCVSNSCTPEGERRLTFVVEHPGQLVLHDDLERTVNPEVPLSEWYRDCAHRDQAINLRIAARLLSKIKGALRVERLPDQTRYCFELYSDAAAGMTVSETPKTERLYSEPISNGEVSRMQDPNKSSEAPLKHQAARILVVDDIEENRTLLEVILSKLGHVIVQCSGGRQAISMCSQERFDLILMDIQMPEINGLEAIRRIRTDSLNAGVPIIAMTASNQKDDELAALESGSDDYLNKPINRRLLEQKIWRSLAKMRQIQEAEQGLDITSFLEGDPDYHKTIETFVGNLPNRIEEMREALNNRDMQDLAFKAHALKGLGGFAGFAVYTEKAAQLEASIHEQDVDKIQAQIDEMVQMCLRTKIKADTM